MLKITFLIIFLPIISYAQYPEDNAPPEPVNQTTDTNFINENRLISWQKVFQGNASQINYPKLINGKGENCNIGNCKGTSSFTLEDFNFDYIIEEKENRYRVTVNNIRFNNSIQINLGGVITDNKSNSFEFFMTRNKDGYLRKNQTARKNLECLNNFLTNIFSPKAKVKNDDW